MEFTRKPLFQILFFNNHEYYFEFDMAYDFFKLNGLNIKDIKYKVGTFCFKILSNINNIIDYVDNCQEEIYNSNNNFDTIRNAIFNLENNLTEFDRIFSRITIDSIFNKIGNRNLKIKETEKELEILKKFLKDFNNDTMDLSDYKRTKEDLKDLKKVKDDKFIISLLNDYIYSINNARLFIDYYFNLVVNDEIRKNLKDKSQNIRAYSLQALCNLTLTLPKSEKILCIIDNDKLIPTTSYLLHKSTKPKYSEEEQIQKYLEYEKLLHNGNINNDIVYYSEIYNIYSIADLLNVSINYFIQNNITVSKCKNCGKYFIPVNKNNETLCDNIYKNRQNL